MNIELLEELKNKTVLVFGDYMVDKYINGDVKRISPEAPVPVIEVKNETQKLGGAGNVINNIVSLGGKVKVLACIGNDVNGKFIIDSFNNNNIDKKYLKKYDEIDTIVKTRVVSKNQQFLRIDKEKKEPILECYIRYIKENIEDVFNGVDVLIISDYCKGAVSKEISQLLIKNARKRNISIIIDPKGTDYSKYKGATMITPNLKELSAVVNKEVETEDDIKKYGKKLVNDLDLKYLVLTRSEKGITTVDSSGKKQDFPAIAKEVIDVSGAGDTVVATTALLEALEYPIENICKIANMAASVVVSKFGTSTVSLNELMKSIYSFGDFKYQTVESLKYIIQDLKDKGKKVVFTNGCFDMLHVGHLSSFKQAREFGDILIVAVNSDASVKQNKGDLRPIINENDRIKMITELECVDYVLLMNDKTPEKIIEELKPDISVKGEDWKDKEVPEEKILKSYGGKLEYIKLSPGNSTTKIIERVIKAYGKE
ncbi:MAG: D-glycero-beta-D-manno-heptose-7-phosphate kinase [Firmicutes bacterium]|nr:D-glycero-beta-D-manno-heptose-7-phosphate kinase [Bacillota bacterium]